MNDFLNKAKDMAADNPDKVSEGIDKGKDFANEKTGGQHSEHIDKAADAAEQHLTGGGDEQK